jgi:nucleoid DNA-binding protein
MAELKTKINDASVEKFISTVKDEEKRKDCLTLLELMKKTMKEEPKMWGTSIVGFGSFHYKGKSGREGDWFVTGFSPRKQNMTVYFCLGFKHLASLLKGLGKFQTSMGCLYFKNLSAIDIKVLKEMLVATKKDLPNLVKRFNNPA